MDLSSGGMPIVRISIKLNISKSEHLDALFLQTMIKNIDSNSIYFDLNILNLDHQFQTQLSSLMWDYDHDVLPLSLRSHFKRANLLTRAQPLREAYIILKQIWTKIFQISRD